MVRGAKLALVTLRGVSVCNAEVGSRGLSLKHQPRSSLYDIAQIQRNGHSTVQHPAETQLI